MIYHGNFGMKMEKVLPLQYSLNIRINNGKLYN